MNNTVSAQIEKLYKLNEQLFEIADKLLVERPIKNERSLFACFMLVKGYKTHKAITLLCKNDLGEDAFMHSRTLFELSIVCSFILQDKTDLRLRQYIDHEVVMRKEYFDRSSTSVVSNADLNAQLLADYEAAMSKHSYSKWRGRWSEEDISERADKVKRGHEYKTLYKMQCNSAHSHVVSMEDYVDKESVNEMAMNLGSNLEMIKLALVASFDSFRWILAEFNEEFDFKMNNELEKAVQEFKDLAAVI